MSFSLCIGFLFCVRGLHRRHFGFGVPFDLVQNHRRRRGGQGIRATLVRRVALHDDRLGCVLQDVQRHAPLLGGHHVCARRPRLRARAAHYALVHARRPPLRIQERWAGRWTRLASSVSRGPAGECADARLPYGRRVEAPSVAGCPARIRKPLATHQPGLVAAIRRSLERRPSKSRCNA